jgi:hypothetical protein
MTEENFFGENQAIELEKAQPIVDGLVNISKAVLDQHKIGYVSEGHMPTHPLIQHLPNLGEGKIPVIDPGFSGNPFSLKFVVTTDNKKNGQYDGLVRKTLIHTSRNVNDQGVQVVSYAESHLVSLSVDDFTDFFTEHENLDFWSVSQKIDELKVETNGPEFRLTKNGNQVSVEDNGVGQFEKMPQYLNRVSRVIKESYPPPMLLEFNVDFNQNPFKVLAVPGKQPIFRNF